MVKYVGVSDAASMVAAIGVGPFLARLARYIRADYARWHDFDKSPRPACHSHLGVIELMPIADRHAYAFKFVNGHPANTRAGKLTVTAFGALADVATGYPGLIAEMTLMTALRTAATSAFAASLMARPESRTMALLGAGAQAEFQALAFHVILGVDTIRLYDPDPHAIAKVMRNLARVRDLDIVPALSAHDAVDGVDIVTTVTASKSKETILTPPMVRPGMHINAVGGDCPGKTELHPDILRNARVVVEYLPQSRIEGEIQQLAPDIVVPELWQVLDGTEPGRASATEITVFDSVGFAIEDFSTLRLVNDVAEETGLFSVLDLVPELPDPKDLFSLVAHAGVPARPSPLLTA